MAKEKKVAKGAAVGRADRVRLSAAESLKRLHDFSKRREQFVAAVRKGIV